MKVRFDSRIYKLAAIRLAAQAFDDLADIRVAKQGVEYVVTFENYDESLGEELVHEFANHALFHTIAMRGIK